MLHRWVSEWVSDCSCALKLHTRERRTNFYIWRRRLGGVTKMEERVNYSLIPTTTTTFTTTTHFHHCVYGMYVYVCMFVCIFCPNWGIYHKWDTDTSCTQHKYTHPHKVWVWRVYYIFPEQKALHLMYIYIHITYTPIQKNPQERKDKKMNFALSLCCVFICFVWLSVLLHCNVFVGDVINIIYIIPFPNVCLVLVHLYLYINFVLCFRKGFFSICE